VELVTVDLDDESMVGPVGVDVAAMDADVRQRFG
jgi:hypothetical protein